ncbi:MAG: DUF2244 domain-containing protein [Gammaproteobacteria bacterium]|nr:DUF2244 domain-containing protein [Gammaproteobacteria bacterium]MBL6998679.1 DUF2244 domain-containing protein [Gammaproteobacteria bacterium]
MLIEKSDSGHDRYDFLIRPNRSMTTKGMIVFVLLVGVGVFLTAIRFVLLGAWLVLPFAILEIALLVAGFWMFDRASRYREMVQVSRDRFLITQESVRGKKIWKFNPFWVQINLTLDPDDWYPSQLFVQSHGDRVEIGACLTDQEREELLAALHQLLPKVLEHNG